MKFKEWKTPAGFSGSALFNEKLGRGIYILYFENGEEYVGQTVNFMHRFSSHRRRWSDSVSIRFATVPEANLDELEQHMIAQKLDEGAILRNLNLLSSPLGPSKLNEIIDRQVQQDWLNLDENYEVLISDERFNEALNSKPTDQKFLKLTEHPQYQDILDSVAFYVGLVIPCPDVVEGKHWVLTALPSTARHPDNRRVATLSVHNVELMYLGEYLDDDGKWEPYTRLNVAPLTSIPADIEQLVEEPTSHYKSAGITQSIDFNGFDYVPALLTKFPEVLTSARSITLGQMRKGTAAHSRFHNRDFANAAFRRIYEINHRNIEQ